jgi:hypothetical protein
MDEEDENDRERVIKTKAHFNILSSLRYSKQRVKNFA